MKTNKGVSLIVLIITIIVIVILASAVIVNLSKNNVINQAGEAKFKSDAYTYSNDLSLWMQKQLVENLGNYDPAKLNSATDSNDVLYNGQRVGTISDVIVSMSSMPESDRAGYKIVEGKLTYVGQDDIKQSWASDLGIGEIIVYTDEKYFEVWEPTGSIYVKNQYWNQLPSNIVLPKSIGGVTATTIDGWTFSGLQNLTSIVIPDTIKTISPFAFSQCTNLVSVKLPNSITSISANSFEETAFENTLRNNAIDGVVTINNNILFSVDPSKSGSYTIPSNITIIAGNAFGDCSSLTSITIPSNVVNMGELVFNDCTGLTSATIPESVTTIGNSIFSGCTSLISVSLPNNMSTIPPGMFRMCTHLSNISIPSSVKNIGYAAFDYCSSLSNIIIPLGVISIDPAFNYCSSLTSITIPSSVTSISSYTFYDCNNLTSIIINKPSNSISGAKWNAPSGCTVTWNG